MRKLISQFVLAALLLGVFVGQVHADGNISEPDPKTIQEPGTES